MRGVAGRWTASRVGDRRSQTTRLSAADRPYTHPDQRLQRHQTQLFRRKGHARYRIFLCRQLRRGRRSPPAMRFAPLPPPAALLAQRQRVASSFSAGCCGTVSTTRSWRCCWMARLLRVNRCPLRAWPESSGCLHPGPRSARAVRAHRAGHPGGAQGVSGLTPADCGRDRSADRCSRRGGGRGHQIGGAGDFPGVDRAGDGEQPAP